MKNGLEVQVTNRAHFLNILGPPCDKKMDSMKTMERMETELENQMLSADVDFNSNFSQSGPV